MISMKINILCYEPPNGWILWDYAVRVATALAALSQKVEINHVQRSGFDLTYHINYAGFGTISSGGVHSTMVTHIDTPQKFQLVASQARAGVHGICMSEETARKLRQLTGESRFDAALTPSLLPKKLLSLKVTIGSRLYPDGRKNESWVVEFARKFKPGYLCLRIMGSGWESIVAKIELLGHRVDYHPTFDGGRYVNLLTDSDYVLYTGFDEGSLSTIDSAVCGVPFIATAQGFHLELPGDNLLYTNFSELMDIASSLQARTESLREASNRLLDWGHYARRLMEVWEPLVVNSSSPV